MRVRRTFRPSNTVSLLALVLGVLSEPSAAQIVPDASLPVPSTVEIDNRLYRITGGTTAGHNLFHSFSQFDLETGSIAQFENSAAIANIITRITGNAPSFIDGTLRANGVANLYLLNRNGLTLGDNARLDIGGSFFGTTGDRLLFSDGSSFPSILEDNPPLLSVSVPLGVQMGPNSGNIAVTGSGHNLSFADDFSTVRDDRALGFAVSPGATLQLIGGDIAITGGNLTAANGSISLVSLKGGTWNFDENSVSAATGGEIRLSAASSVDVSGNGGGHLTVIGRNLFLADGSTLLADTLGDAPGDGIEIRTTALVDVRGIAPGEDFFASGFFAAVGPGASGDGGNVFIESDRLVVEEGSIVGADTFGAGNAGTFTVRAREIETRESSWSGSSFTAATGNGGRIKLDADRILIADGAQILSFTLGGGDAGSIAVRSNVLEVRGVNAGTFNSVIVTTSEAGSTGRGGTITVDTGILRLAEGGAISTGTSGDAITSAAGTLTVRATEAIELIGTDENGVPATLSTTTFSDAPGADLFVETPRLVARDGGQVSAGTFGGGDGGRVVLNVSEMELSGSTAAVEVRNRDFFVDESQTRFPSGVFSSSEGGGAAGDLLVNGDRILVRDGAELTVSSSDRGEAGSLAIDTSRLTLESGGRIRGDSASGAGSLRLNLADLRLFGGSRISTNARGTEPGGNIEIDTDTLVALDNSDITANALNSFGGRIQIEAVGVFGTAFRSQLTPESDITATSALGSSFSGVVELREPEVETNSPLVELSSEVVDLSGLVADGCSALRSGSRFVVTGRGGLSRETPDRVTVGGFSRWEPKPLGETTEAEKSREEERSPLQEATGWVTHADGRVQLIIDRAR
ncbi:beta strand repeat-containing protein [Baaleninema simplex]|uniref:beta strand repeat-containing protein n=1 Tax=Baaleninema simplex TaxID=2862350 RepID=UPI00037E93FC|nr:S-layer family protein [Baaleninema simplex]